MHITEPQPLAGMDSLDTVRVRSFLVGLASRHGVVVEMLDDLDEQARVQVRVHAYTEEERDAALADVAALAEKDQAQSARSSAAVIDETRDEFARRRRNPEFMQRDLAAAEFTGNPGPMTGRPHARWECGGCPDCVEMPHGEELPS